MLAASLTLAALSLVLVSFFFLLLPPPPTSPLFPYTTLFRSHRARARVRLLLPARLGAGAAGPAGSDLVAAAARDRPLSDRKSTRLNSSHLGISYAVFCLKKKKKKKNRPNNK